MVVCRLHILSCNSELVLSRMEIIKLLSLACIPSDSHHTIGSSSATGILKNMQALLEHAGMPLLKLSANTTCTERGSRGLSSKARRSANTQNRQVCYYEEERQRQKTGRKGEKPGTTACAAGHPVCAQPA